MKACWVSNRPWNPPAACGSNTRLAMELSASAVTARPGNRRTRERASRLRRTIWTLKLRELKARSVKFSMETMDTPVCRFAMICDPDGNKIMIHKRNYEDEGSCRKLRRLMIDEADIGANQRALPLPAGRRSGLARGHGSRHRHVVDRKLAGANAGGAARNPSTSAGFRSGSPTRTEFRCLKMTKRCSGG